MKQCVSLYCSVSQCVALCLGGTVCSEVLIECFNYDLERKDNLFDEVCCSAL